MANDVTFRRMEKATETLNEVASRVLAASGSTSAGAEDVPMCLKVVFGIGTNEIDPGSLSVRSTGFSGALVASHR